MQAGNIAVLTGMKSTVTGDTLVASKRAAEMASERRRKLTDEDLAGAYNLFFQTVKIFHLIY